MRLFRPAQFFAALVYLAVVSPISAQTVWHTDLDEARKIAQQSNKPILCHFYADWCGPCQQMERQVFPNRQLQQSLRDTVVAVKIDVKHQPHLSNRFGITSLPTDLFLEPDGQQLLQSTGFRNSNDYVRLVLRAQTRYADLLAARQPAPTTENPIVANEESAPGNLKQAAASKVMLKGYCPVTLWNSRRWEKGSVQYQTEYKGQIYQMASAEMLNDFRDTPERFIPQFLGCDPIVVWETDRAVSGTIQFAAFYDEKLYLFTNDENRKRFKQSPDKFVTTQVVLHVDQIESTSVQ